MPGFQPRDILRILEEYRVRYIVIGNLGGTLYGSPLVTRDIDICPARSDQNLAALAAALRAMDARIRAPDVPKGLPFACDAAFLEQVALLNLITQFGELDLAFEPAGTGGYDDLSPRAVAIALHDGLCPRVAALEDIIRSKEAANREKDRLALPTLRLLLETRRRGPSNA